jgi:uncharacterized Zn finger protein
MSGTPSIDYMCPDCGAMTIYQLVVMETTEPRPAGEPGEIPSLDFSCARCGAIHTYTLSPANPAS